MGVVAAAAAVVVVENSEVHFPGMAALCPRLKGKRLLETRPGQFPPYMVSFEIATAVTGHRNH